MAAAGDGHELRRHARRLQRCVHHYRLLEGHDIVGVTIRDTDIVDSTYDGIQFKNGGGNMPDVKITNVRIEKSNNGSGILAMGGARGNAILSNVTVTSSRDGDVAKEPGSQFTFTGQ